MALKGHIIDTRNAHSQSSQDAAITSSNLKNEEAENCEKQDEKEEVFNQDLKSFKQH